MQLKGEYKRLVLNVPFTMNSFLFNLLEIFPKRLLVPRTYIHFRWRIMLYKINNKPISQVPPKRVKYNLHDSQAI